MEKDFYINDQFLVKPDANLLVDGLISKISKVEPGAMRLLCILAGNNHRLVSKEELITLTWNDGSGSDEKLNQAISTLRKLLQDDKKTLIKQVAQKGYSFQASVFNADIDDLTKEAAAKPIRLPATAAQKWIIALSFLIFLLLLIFALFNYTYSTEPLD
ncbi:MAG: hypothetical protein DI535_01560 [Citrobacter freundii]|nr:MAG: hypothetical protein DI535_01560 [Citrobacter freundii]